MEEMEIFIGVWLSAMALLCYCYAIAASAPKGTLRLITFLPVFYLLAVLPLGLSSFQLVAPTAFVLVWLCNFKLLLFAFDAGPLARSPSCLRFILVAASPIKIKKETPTKKPTLNLPGTAPGCFPERLGASLPAKVLLQALLLRACDYRPYMHPWLVWVLYGANTFFGIQLVLAIYAIPGWVILGRFGFELEAQFNKPLLTTSLEDFWGRRWNLTVSQILRLTVYNPFRDVCAYIAGPELGSYASVMATFTVSGLMHEAVFYYFMRVAPTWEVTAYFIIQGASLVVEKASKKRLRGSRQPSRVVSGVSTLGFLGFTAVWLIGLPLTKNGIDEKAIMECHVMLNFLKEKVWPIFALIDNKISSIT